MIQKKKNDPKKKKEKESKAQSPQVKPKDQNLTGKRPLPRVRTTNPLSLVSVDL